MVVLIVFLRIILLGGIDGSVFAVDSATGEQLWVVHTGGPLFASGSDHFLTAGTATTSISGEQQISQEPHIFVPSVGT